MKIETLAGGYGLIEGPRVDAAGNLYFSDVQNGGVYRRGPDGRIETIVPRRRGVGGIAQHAEGGIVISGRNVCHVRDGETRVLFEQDDIPGFNDIFTDARGRVYCGSMRADPFRVDGPRTPGELWRIDGPGRVVELYGGVSLSNGIGLSPDGCLLYHSDTAAQHIVVHELTPDGRARDRRALDVAPGFPDGLAVDEEGCICVALYGGGCVARYRPDGTHEGRIEVPARSVTSLCFGGADRRDLYVVSADNTDDPERGGSIFRTCVDVPGLPAPLARV
jgi:gluconolactonase